jgi:hypothetical protein
MQNVDAKELVLLSLTGAKVHYPAVLDQTATSHTACAPFGRMGKRQMRLRWVTESAKYTVNCNSCLAAGKPTV